MVYKWCVVPQCKNTTIRTPQKLFISVPKNTKRRKKWLKLAGRDSNRILSPTSSVFMCEDHFDIEKDITNYMKYKMGFSMKILLSEEAVPFKFQCQENCKRRKRKSGPRGSHKRQRAKPLKKSAQTQYAIQVHNESFPKDFHNKEIIEPKDEAAPTNFHCQEVCKTLIRHQTDAVSSQVDKKKDIMDSIQKSPQNQNVTDTHAESFLKDYTIKVEIIENKDDAAPTEFNAQEDSKTLLCSAGSSPVFFKKQSIDSIEECPQSRNVIDAHAESFLKDYTIKVEIEYEESPETQDSMQVPLAL